MTEKVNLRAIALDTLIEINEHDFYSHQILRTVLDKYQYLEKQQRAFLTRLVEGTLEHMLELDYTINAFSKVKIKKQKPLIRNLLRMSVYQLKYMDSIPDSAVCNEAVKLAKKRGFSQLSGFVNGVLRGIARGEDPVEKLDRERNPAEYLEIVYSTPRWIVEQWMETYGYEQTEGLLETFFKEAPLTIRTNLLKCTPQELCSKLKAEGVTIAPVHKLDYAFEISGFDHLNALESFRMGWFYVQDISSMMVVETAKQHLQSESGDSGAVYVIDVCAAPGGKSTHMAEVLGVRGMVEARDLTEYKVGLIEENILRHELANMKAVQQDATIEDKNSIEKADILLCDLPCSGLGVMGRKPDIRYKMTPKKQQELVLLQRKILDTVHQYVKTGGILVYSTCTIDQAENEENVRWFLRKYPEFSLEYEEQLLPGTQYFNGFFIAKFIRRR